jgi:hypothetical protein
LEAALASFDAAIPVYLDLNVFSRMQGGESQRQSLLDLLSHVRRKGVIFVYSMVHVDECRGSDQPEALVEAIEGVSAHFLEQTKVSDTRIILSPTRARELILAEFELADEASRRMQDLLKLMHFALGWLGEIEAKALLEELLEDLELYWKSLENELPREMLDLLAHGKAEMFKSIRDMPLHQVKEEGLEVGNRLRENLPKNYAQLDAVPADDVVEYLLSRLDENEHTEIRNSYPPQFWAAVKTRQEGSLTGFSFLLFVMGLVRDARVKKRDRQRRAKHFLGQFQDCRHIEAASRCAMFVTFDNAAARLARAVYAYAGVKTEVVHLEVP